jgi:aspartyl/asparaginyl beta-hydroxylase (cupin superfamily)
MGSGRFPFGFTLVTAFAVVSLVLPCFLGARWVGFGWALLATCAAHLVGLVLTLRISARVPRWRHAPSYSLQEHLMPYAGHCPGFEDPARLPPWAHQIEQAYEEIRREFECALQTLSQRSCERVMLLEPTTGAWVPQRTDGWIVDRNAKLMTRDEAWQHLQVAQHCPKTWGLLNTIPGFRGECSFSKLAPHARIKAHSGESDLYYRCHLGIRIPGPLPGAGFEVGKERCSWQEGKLLVFCDGYRHSAWNDYDEDRTVLLFNVIRPEFAIYESAFQRCYNLLMYLKTGITSHREPFYRRPLFVWLSILGVIYANSFGTRASRVSTS